MKRAIIGTLLSTMVMSNAASADTWVFRDTLRPNGHDRTMAAKLADGRRCGLSHNSFKDRSPFVPCMLARGWALDHIIPDPPSAHVRSFVSRNRAPVNNSDDDWVARQRAQDNTQQMLNNQQDFNNTQQMVNDQQAQQQQQQMINDMNDH
jgi:hypothetical protein